ncbi:plasmid fertility inhibition factor family protein [Edaphobacter modestus]|uniref:Uncharacterized protein n=1 Tax=Edaphobacter modestus TaxID=388466 RepID=A0A4Q7XXV6_9BACT|nr:hypothetical protein [Edaphobacter modestus]RZU28918.1 hypothetical protein BDD14_6503 [Edaphobacter modestus]
MAKLNFLQRLRSFQSFKQKLVEVIEPSTSQPFPEVVELTYHHCVWKIEAEQEAFMIVRRTPFNNESRFVVIVDGEKFYKLWRSTPETSCAPRIQMPLDYRYAHAVEGFSAGLKNPVPLAEVNFSPSHGKKGVSFTNGTTRTLWLLAHRAKAFPILLGSESSSQELHRLAGTSSPPITVASLLPEDW